MAAFSTILGALTLGLGAAGAAYSMGSSQKQSSQSVPDLPKAPDTSQAQAVATAEAKKKRSLMRKSQTIFTSPLGIGGEASVARKTLLGQ